MEYEDVSIISWDTPNNHTGRALRQHYFAQADALIYVVDSADRERLPETREDLQELLEAEHLAGLPLLVLANKEDLPASKEVGELIECFNLQSLKDRDWYIQSCCANGQDEGLLGGFEWLFNTLKRTAGQRRVSRENSQ